MQNIEEFKKIVADNLVKYRKASNLTQLELAEKINYSDKAVSKWERGESIPDALVLKEIADIYSISVDDLLTKSKENEKQKVPFSIKRAFKSKHTLITLLSAGLVWLIACIVFVALIIFKVVNRAYLAFIYAVPVSSIVCLVFSLIWAKKWVSGIFTTLIIWGTFLSIYLTFDSTNLWIIFIIAIPLQILTVLWFWLMKETTKIKWHLKRDDKVKHEESSNNDESTKNEELDENK